MKHVFSEHVPFRFYWSLLKYIKELVSREWAEGFQ